MQGDDHEEGVPGAGLETLDGEALRLRVEVSDLRRLLIREQEQRALLALELHRATRELERVGGAVQLPSMGPDQVFGDEMETLKLRLYLATSDLHRAVALNDRLLAELRARLA